MHTAHFVWVMLFIFNFSQVTYLGLAKGQYTQTQNILTKF